MRPTGTDARDEAEDLVYKVLLLHTGRKFSKDELAKLDEVIDFGNEVVPPPSYLIESDSKYVDYIRYVGTMAKKNKWSNATIISLLLSPSRAHTGWLSRGGTTINKKTWKALTQN